VSVVIFNLSLVGLNHRTAPVALREKVAFPENALAAALAQLKEQAGVREAYILSTCNRVEIVVSGHQDVELTERLPIFLSNYHGLPLEEMEPHLYTHEERQAVRHIFRVAASLDSMMVGEPQILGQVRSAYAAARAAGSIGGPLDEVMVRAIRVARKVRNETGIARSAVSISFAAVELARKIFGELKGKTVMLIGAGKMAELAAHHLRDNGASMLLVANRNAERSAQLAAKYQGEAVPFEDLLEQMSRADIVISSTGASSFLVRKQDGQPILSRRRNRPMFFVDIAVPRDIDPELNKVDNIFVYDIDDLQEVIQSNLKEREHEAQLGEQIVEKEVEHFLERMRTLEVVPTIVSLQSRLEEIRHGEIERLRGKLGSLTPEQEAAIEQITRGIVNKVAHPTIAQLKSNPELGMVDAVRRLFNLK
jgi:glutamyl-tRNA reductase